MVQQVTRGIKISVETSFEGTLYKNYNMQYAFGYKITIENNSKDAVQLYARHWEILDALSSLEVVSGEGVVGLKPVLMPGESHTYKSGCMLTSPFGAMSGYYNMINLNNSNTFKVAIPSFKLSAPFAIN
ncbi:Co2+/Mg2+ efflux protein ApaG [Formosa algae]|jgi:ApaG protein|uniref:ApaG protein n=1 Tax=Formosa algae TaxID=225843 RepID=A0A9X1CBC9_9FLAO|nr:Co2+/Mg2+ efflux protein ApaG [Formosa algae]MBP1839075.1 ApaG protein [Formosa algae]MDQ0333852.1 ApaG protein [Formosa algae]OEI80912.1 Co2+/Mg2+ efflux protein ApaG [Formosa algae]PNW26792.1 Co2+/Mg2+ efflux protein ApaG [Formosa algae]